MDLLDNLKKFSSPPLISFLVCSATRPQAICREMTTTATGGSDSSAAIALLPSVDFESAGGGANPVGVVGCVSQHFLGNQNYISAGVIPNR